MRFGIPFSTDTQWWRWGSVLLTGFGVRFLADLIFALTYRNYPLQWSLADYSQALVLAFLALEGVGWVNRRLDRVAPWHFSFSRRLLLQSLANAAWVLFVVLVIRNGLFRYVLQGDYQFISLPDEIVIATVTVLLTLLAVWTELGVFLLNKWRFSLAELERFKKENIEFHLEMLKTQVNPHFLFNSLNTLSSLIYADRDTAAQFVHQLAKVYRYVLDNRDKEVIPLREELQFLQSYLYLMNLRLGHNLRIHIQVPEAAHPCLIAPLTLQLLIENAIKHNIVSQKKPLTVRIDWAEPEQLVISNNLQPKPVKEHSTRIGLKNIRSRYAFITDREVRVEQDEKFFNVTVPLLRKTHELPVLTNR